MPQPAATTRPESEEPQLDTLPARVRKPLERAALSTQRQALVRDNIGLVHVHLRHATARSPSAWSDRDREDFVQEGCLGLIRAAQDFNPQGSIPFAAFALPRIHTAVHRAMLRRQAIGERPLDASTTAAGGGGKAALQRARRSGFRADPLEALGEWYGSGTDTIGVRLREKFDRAVRRAVVELSTDAAEGSPGSLLQALAVERHLVPDVHARKPFRQLARQLGEKYARVTHYDRLLRSAIARILSGDPEFAALTDIARTQETGLDGFADRDLDVRLARLGAAELLQRILHSPADHRERALNRLFSLAPQSLLQSLERELEVLPVEVREELLSCTSPLINVSTL